ncbi:MAG: hypothetical protein V4625_20740 [Pseudomonadota bacterium]
MATAKKATAPKTATTKVVAKKPASPAVKKPTAAPAKPKAAVKKPPVKAPISKTVKAKPAKTVKPAKVEKPKKPKLVRDSFTIPKAEYVVLDALKLRAAKLTRPAKKSELLRAGIKALAALSDAAFLTALEQVPAIKTGRPAAGK